MYEFLNYRACDFSTRSPITISPDASLREAEVLFGTHQFNALPVIEGSDIVGWLTKLDVLKAFQFSDESIFPQYDQIMETPVRAVMTELRDLVRVTPRTPLTRVLKKMVQSGAKSLPVVDGDTLAGVIAREDVLRALRRATRPEDEA